MTDLRNQRRMAASLLKCGINRVWIDPDRSEEIAKAVTRGDIGTLIRGDAIQSKQIKGISSGRKKFIKGQKKKGRRKGPGSREGAKYARLPKKERWIRTIRPLRNYIKKLRDEKKINPKIYRVYYRRTKGGEFKSKEHLRTHLVADGILNKDEVKQK
ncbi:LSU ribosomal protein L19E [Thermoplasmatales archaeon SCGC AB-539-N05]|nr:LSU ribosomal protein L19E [Thermoplasmatales archaeon SCGC AB-539-N05]ENO12303.1 LSU ribosomal protein L19E [Thermoplasmatales archaeon SCGC AB-539-C06]